MTNHIAVNSDVSLEDFSTDELIQELQNRGEYDIKLLSQIYHLRRQGKSYEKELDFYISDILGIVV